MAASTNAGSNGDQKWACAACTFLNYSQHLSCDICGTPRSAPQPSFALPSANLKDMEELFETIDFDKSGYITIDEIFKALQMLGAPQELIIEEVETMMARDENGDGKLSKAEFCCSNYTIGDKDARWLTENIRKKLEQINRAEELKLEVKKNAKKGRAFFKYILGDVLLQNKTQVLHIEGIDGAGGQIRAYQSVDVESVVSKADYVAIYLGGYWCPPCRYFFPEFAKIFHEIRKKGTKLEVIYVSCDHDKRMFEEYFNKMPWYAVPFTQENINKFISWRSRIGLLHEVKGIPFVAIYDKEGNILSGQGAGLIRKYKEKFLQYLLSEAHDEIAARVCREYNLNAMALHTLHGTDVPWSRSRLMLVGKGRSGKTSLYKSLKGEEFDSKQQSTVMADVDVQDILTSDQEGTFQKTDMGGDHERTMVAAMKLHQQMIEESKKRHAGQVESVSCGPGGCEVAPFGAKSDPKAAEELSILQMLKAMGIRYNSELDEPRRTAENTTDSGGGSEGSAPSPPGAANRDEGASAPVHIPSFDELATFDEAETNAALKTLGVTDPAEQKQVWVRLKPLRQVHAVQVAMKEGEAGPSDAKGKEKMKNQGGEESDPVVEVTSVGLTAPEGNYDAPVKDAIVLITDTLPPEVRAREAGTPPSGKNPTGSPGTGTGPGSGSSSLRWFSEYDHCTKAKYDEMRLLGQWANTVYVPDIRGFTEARCEPGPLTGRYAVVKLIRSWKGGNIDAGYLEIKGRRRPPKAQEGKHRAGSKGRPGPSVPLILSLVAVGDPAEEEGGEHGARNMAKRHAPNAFCSKRLHNVTLVFRIKVPGKEDAFMRRLDMLKIKTAMDKDTLRLSVWDFAGQEVFYTAHVLFLVRNCLYLVVFSLEEWADPIRHASAKRFLEFWFESIRTYAEGARFCIVGTHRDVLEERYPDPAQLGAKLVEVSKEVQRMARSVFVRKSERKGRGGDRKQPAHLGSASSSSPCLPFESRIRAMVSKAMGGAGKKPPLIPWVSCELETKQEAKAAPTRFGKRKLVFFPVSNLHGGTDRYVVRLRKAIQDTLKDDEKVNETVPLRWTKVCDILTADREENRMGLRQIAELAEGEGVPEAEVKPMLRKFHELGVVIYFDEKGMREHAILKPQFLIDRVKRIIYDANIHDEIEEDDELFVQMEEEVEDFKEGILHPRFLRYLWGGEAYRDADDRTRVQMDEEIAFVLNILEKNMVICRFAGAAAARGSATVDEAHSSRVSTLTHDTGSSAAAPAAADSALTYDLDDSMYDDMYDEDDNDMYDDDDEEEEEEEKEEEAAVASGKGDDEGTGAVSGTGDKTQSKNKNKKTKKQKKKEKTSRRKDRAASITALEDLVRIVSPFQQRASTLQADAKLGARYLVPSMLRNTLLKEAVDQSHAEEIEKVLAAEGFGSFLLEFERFMPHSFYEMVLARMLSALSAGEHMALLSRRSLLESRPFRMEDQLLSRTDAVISAPPMRFVMRGPGPISDLEEYGKIQTPKNDPPAATSGRGIYERLPVSRRRGSKGEVADAVPVLRRSIRITILSHASHCAPLLELVRDIALKLLGWPYNESLRFGMVFRYKDWCVREEDVAASLACNRAFVSASRKFDSRTGAVVQVPGAIERKVSVLKLRRWESNFYNFIESVAMRPKVDALFKSFGPNENGKVEFAHDYFSKMKQVLSVLLMDAENHKGASSEIVRQVEEDFQGRFERACHIALSDHDECMSFAEFREIVWSERPRNVRRAKLATEFEGKMGAWLDDMLNMIQEKDFQKSEGKSRSSKSKKPHTKYQAKGKTKDDEENKRTTGQNREYKAYVCAVKITDPNPPETEAQTNSQERAIGKTDVMPPATEMNTKAETSENKEEVGKVSQETNTKAETDENKEEVGKIAQETLNTKAETGENKEERVGNVSTVKTDKKNAESNTLQAKPPNISADNVDNRATKLQNTGVKGNVGSNGQGGAVQSAPNACCVVL